MRTCLPLTWYDIYICCPAAFYEVRCAQRKGSKLKLGVVCHGDYAAAAAGGYEVRSIGLSPAPPAICHQGGRQSEQQRNGAAHRAADPRRVSAAAAGLLWGGCCRWTRRGTAQGC